jgi:Ferritin-like domain
MTQSLRTTRKSTDKEANEMASSNDIEVLDPTATVEKLKNIVSKVALNRRHFMAALGAAGIAAGTRLGSGPVARAQQPTPNGFAQTDVINFLLNIKYLKATFYSYVTTGADLPGSSYVTLASGQVFNAPGKITFSGTNAAQITDMFNEMYYDELNQLIDLRNLLGVASVPRTTMNLLGNSVANATYATPSGTVISTGAQAIGQARMLEDISVTAFAGALSYLTGPNLAIATQILAVDGCHAAALRLASIQTGAAYQGTLYQSNFQIGTNGTNIVTAILASTAAVVGDIITAPGLIPAGAVITAITPAASKTPTGVVINTSKVITGMSSIAGLAVGQPITGTGIPANTYIATPAPSGTTINISNAVTATPTAVTPTGYLTAGSTSITGVSSVSGLVIGQPITSSTTAVVGQVLGVIPAGTTITAASGTTITMSQAASATGTVTITGIVTNGSTTLTPVSSTTGLATGQVINGAGIPSGTKISTIGTTVTLSVKATATSPATTTFNGIINATLPTSLTAPTSSNNPAVITQVTSAAGVPGTAGLGLSVNQPLTAPGIAPGALITLVGANTVTMSLPAIASSTVTPTGTVTAGSNVITNVTSIAGVTVGQVIAGPTISFTAITTNASTSLTKVSINASFTAITTSGSPTLTSVSSLTGLAIGQILTGAGIPANTAIIAISGTTITMSANATASVSTAVTITSSAGLAVGQVLSAPVSFTGITTNASPILTSVSSVTGLAVGQGLTGTGIPANAVISSIVSTAPFSITMSANANYTITTAEPITSTGPIPLNTTISSISGTTITMSAAANATISSAMTVVSSGPVPYNATVTSVGATVPYSITMSAPANVTLAPIVFSGVTTAGSNTITNAWGVGASGTAVLTGLVAGQPITGAGIPTGATITSWGTVYPYSITMSQNATATLTPITFTGVTTSGSPTLTDVSSVTGLAAGQALTGTGIPANSVISAISSTAPYTITMVSATTGAAANATLTVTALSTITTSEIMSFPTGVTLTCLSPVPITSGGAVLTSPTVSTVSSPAAETLTVGQGTITISQPALTTGTGTATVSTPDPYEVVPVDPLSATAAALGPALDTSSSPPVYQGFFATAGTNNATSATPAGFAYARTFSQVLAVLYGGTGTGIYEGAFYPEGVAGNINVT